MEYAIQTSRSARRGDVGLPRQGGEGLRGERQGIARPGWLAALPSPPEERKRTRTRRAGWQTVEALPCCWLLVDRRRCVAMWWRWHRPEPDGVAFLPSPCAMLRAGEAASVWRWCGRCRHQTEQKRGEELAKIAAASFALVPSLPVSFAMPYLTT